MMFQHEKKLYLKEDEIKKCAEIAASVGAKFDARSYIKE